MSQLNTCFVPTSRRAYNLVVCNFIAIVCTMSKRKRVDLDLGTRIRIIECRKQGSSQRELATKFKCSKGQVQRIIEKQDDIQKEWNEFSAPKDRKRKRQGKFEDVECKTLEWFREVTAKNIPVSGTLLQEKARAIARDLSVEEFTASNGWLQRFRQRNNIVFRQICGESADVDQCVVADWKERLPLLLAKHSAKNIFNMDETGLFFRALPDKSLVEKGASAKGGKLSKERLTVALCCSALGEKIQPPVIGKSEKPRCFKGVKVGSLGIQWSSNRKAWMNSELFIRWCDKLNANMRNQDRTILLILDNAPCHPRQHKFSNLELLYLPPNVTSCLQPLDQGIIRAFKVNYRKHLMRSLLGKIDSANTASELAKGVNVLDACRWVKVAWNEVTPLTISRCFTACGVACADESSPAEDDSDDDEFLSLAEWLRINQPTAEEDVPAFNSADDHADVSHADVEHAEIPEPTPESDEEEADPPETVTMKEASQMIDRLRLFVSTFSSEGDEHPAFNTLQKLERQIQQQVFANRNNARQSTIREFFQ
jgi:hypothetical protein